MIDPKDYARKKDDTEQDPKEPVVFAVHLQPGLRLKEDVKEGMTYSQLHRYYPKLAPMFRSDPELVSISLHALTYEEISIVHMARLYKRKAGD